MDPMLMSAYTIIVVVVSVVIGYAIFGNEEARASKQQTEPAQIPSQDPVPSPVLMPVSQAKTSTLPLVKLAEADLTTIDELIAGLDAEWQRQRGQLL